MRIHRGDVEANQERQRRIKQRRKDQTPKKRKDMHVNIHSPLKFGQNCSWPTTI